MGNFDVVDEEAAGRLADLHRFQQEFIGLTGLLCGQEKLALPGRTRVTSMQVNPVGMQRTPVTQADDDVGGEDGDGGIVSDEL